MKLLPLYLFGLIAVCLLLFSTIPAWKDLERQKLKLKEQAELIQSLENTTGDLRSELFVLETVSGMRVHDSSKIEAAEVKAQVMHETNAAAFSAPTNLRVINAHP